MISISRKVLADLLTSKVGPSALASRIATQKGPARLTGPELEAAIKLQPPTAKEQQALDPVLARLRTQSLFELPTQQYPVLAVRPLEDLEKGGTEARWDVPQEPGTRFTISNRPVLSSSGRQLFNVSNAGLLRSFDRASGEPLWQLQLTDKPTAFDTPLMSSDGKHLFLVGSSMDNPRMRAVDLITKQLKWAVELPASTKLECAALSPDGLTLIAQDSKSKKLRAFDTRDGSPRWELSGDKMWSARGSTFSRDGKLGAWTYDCHPTASKVEVFDVQTGKSLWKLDTSVYSSSATPVFSLDGKTLFHGREKKLSALDAATGKPRWEIDFETGRNSGPGGMTLSPDGKWLAFTGYAGTYVLDASTGAQRHLVTPITQGSSYDELAPVFTADGLSLIAGDRRGRLRRLDLATGKVTHLDSATAEPEHAGPFVLGPGARYAYRLEGINTTRLRAMELDDATPVKHLNFEPPSGFPTEVRAPADSKLVLNFPDTARDSLRQALLGEGLRAQNLGVDTFTGELKAHTTFPDGSSRTESFPFALSGGSGSRMPNPSQLKPVTLTVPPAGGHLKYWLELDGTPPGKKAYFSNNGADYHLNPE
jgi:outer membrane protein assembly factor BamB